MQCIKNPITGLTIIYALYILLLTSEGDTKTPSCRLSRLGEASVEDETVGNDDANHQDDLAKAIGSGRVNAVQDRVFCGSGDPILHHVCMFVRDMDASVKFYTNGLGLTVRARFDDIVGLKPSGLLSFKVASVFLQAGDGRFIELHPAGDDWEMSPPGFPLNHLAIAVSNVDAVYERAMAHGGAPYGFDMENGAWDGTPLEVVMTGERPEPMRMAFLQAPSGELIELYQSSGGKSAS